MCNSFIYRFYNRFLVNSSKNTNMSHYRRGSRNPSVSGYGRQEGRTGRRKDEATGSNGHLAPLLRRCCRRRLHYADHICLLYDSFRQSTHTSSMMTDVALHRASTNAPLFYFRRLQTLSLCGPLVVLTAPFGTFRYLYTLAGCSYGDIVLRRCVCHVHKLSQKSMN